MRSARSEEVVDHFVLQSGGEKIKGFAPELRFCAVV